MKLNFKKEWLLFVVILFFFSCQRELYFDNIDPGSTPAIYTFNPVNDSCTEFKIHGLYKVGIVLSDSNTVQLKVNVTSPGSYKVSTAISNGISFSDSGNFTSVGVNNIVLRATGIPVDTGIYYFKPASGGCIFSIHFTGSSTETSAGYLMAGSPNSCTGFSLNGVYFTGTSLDPTLNYVDVSVNVISTGTYMIGSPEINNISFSKAGNFTSTGNQIIRLEAHGRPITGGNFAYTVGTFPGSCNFIVNVTAAGPVALGTLDCSMAITAGVFKKATTLDLTNTISIPVNITTPGSYFIATNSINGCVFSGSGNLISGNQTIILNGIGTPVDPGIFSFPVSLGTSNCSFSVSFESN